jgi:hypothetical protein
LDPVERRAPGNRHAEVRQIPRALGPGVDQVPVRIADQLPALSETPRVRPQLLVGKRHPLRHVAQTRSPVRTVQSHRRHGRQQPQDDQNRQ